MVTLKKLSEGALSKAVVMSHEQMDAAKGGVSRKEYCSQLVEIIAHNYDSWDSGQQQNAVNAYHANCNQDWNY